MVSSKNLSAPCLAINDTAKGHFSCCPRGILT
eukprot:Gb_01913 [translate_table: standard]